VARKQTGYREEYDAVVVGSGPNGLAAAITFARMGRSVLLLEGSETVGGGTRTKELTLPGFHHDVCSAIHPLALASPFFRSLDLAAHGLEWIHPPVPLAHPLDNENAVLLHRSIQVTAEGLGQDGNAYRRLVGPWVHCWERLVRDTLRPLGIPRYPLTLLRFGLLAMQSAAGLARVRFRGERAQALVAGNGCHSILPLERPSTAAFGLMLSMLGHGVGWPIAKGGSRAISNALASYLTSLGGKIKVGVPVATLDNLPKAEVVLFDVTPRQLDTIAGPRLPGAYRKRLQSFRYGSGVFKMDWALDGPIPWNDPGCVQAGTLHIGGTLEEIATAEGAVGRGVVPDRPFVLLSQPSLFDPSRAPKGMHTAWAYCHLPNGSTVDMTHAIEAQVERFAAGFRDRIVARHVMSPVDMEAYNPNYIGGSILGGVQGFRELFVRPLGRWRAYAAPAKGIYICSSSMPPGGGVHGMCGYLAAKRALKDIVPRGGGLRA
jgi:phytoene dehydrogenase-like protein